MENENHSDELVKALVESVTRLEVHLKVIKEKLEGIDSRLKSIEGSVGEKPYRSTYAWSD